MGERRGGMGESESYGGNYGEVIGGVAWAGASLQAERSSEPNLYSPTLPNSKTYCKSHSIQHRINSCSKLFDDFRGDL